MIGKQTTIDGSATPAMAMTCPKCGAENTGEARFCRICGVQLAPEGFHEAPTRNFEPNQPSSPQQPSHPEVSPFATYGADGSAILPPRDPRMYVPPSVVQQPGAVMGYQPGTGFAGPVPTNPLQTGPVKKSNLGRIFLAVAGVIILVFVCLIGLGVFIASLENDKVVIGGKGGVEKPVVPGGPVVIVDEGASPDSLQGPIADWYYDGAKIETSVNSSVGGMSGSVLEMTTEDDVDTVAEFYRDKYSDVQSKTEVRESDSITFTGSGTHVVIEPSDDEKGLTSITVVMGSMGGGAGFIPPVPPISPVAPPAVPEPGTPTTDAKPGGDAKTAPKAPAKADGRAEPTPPPAKPSKP